MKTLENISYQTFYSLQTTYACGGVFVDDERVVVYTCPIYHWMVGKDFNYCLSYLVEKGREPLIKELES